MQRITIKFLGEGIDSRAEAEEYVSFMVGMQAKMTVTKPTANPVINQDDTVTFSRDDDLPPKKLGDKWTLGGTGVIVEVVKVE